MQLLCRHGSGRAKCRGKKTWRRMCEWWHGIAWSSAAAQMSDFQRCLLMEGLNTDASPPLMQQRSEGWLGAFDRTGRRWLGSAEGAPKSKDIKNWPWVPNSLAKMGINLVPNLPRCDTVQPWTPNFLPAPLSPPQTRLFRDMDCSASILSRQYWHSIKLKLSINLSLKNSFNKIHKFLEFLV